MLKRPNVLCILLKRQRETANPLAGTQQAPKKPRFLQMTRILSGLQGLAIVHRYMVQKEDINFSIEGTLFWRVPKAQ
jgi:hypothetical protein